MLKLIIILVFCICIHILSKVSMIRKNFNRNYVYSRRLNTNIMIMQRLFILISLLITANSDNCSYLSIVLENLLVIIGFIKCAMYLYVAIYKI